MELLTFWVVNRAAMANINRRSLDVNENKLKIQFNNESKINKTAQVEGFFGEYSMPEQEIMPDTLS